MCLSRFACRCLFLLLEFYYHFYPRCLLFFNLDCGMCAPQVLLVALDYRPLAGGGGRNLWAEWAASPMSEREMAALFAGLARLLHSVPDSENTCALTRHCGCIVSCILT